MIHQHDEIWEEILQKLWQDKEQDEKTIASSRALQIMYAKGFIPGSTHRRALDDIAAAGERIALFHQTLVSIVNARSIGQDPVIWKLSRP